jgi:undecaprenyl pyrophosphate phosphatase UppP
MSAALAGVAMLLLAAEWVVRRRLAAGIEGRDVGQVTWRDAIVVGLAQACALRTVFVLVIDSVDLCRGRI